MRHHLDSRCKDHVTRVGRELGCSLRGDSTGERGRSDQGLGDVRERGFGREDSALGQ